MSSWFRPFRLGEYREPPITQGFGSRYEREPLGWVLQDGSISPVAIPGVVPEAVHRGVDYGLSVGYRVRCPAAGFIRSAEFDSTGFGLSVVVRIGRYWHRFGHLSVLMCKRGESRGQDDILALSGGDPTNPNSGNSNGAHLHWEVYDGTLGLFVFPGIHMVKRPGEAT